MTCSLLLGTALTLFAAAKPKNDYIDRFSAIAIREKNLYNIPASISMAQGILESSWGEGTLAQQNNHFGVKCHTWSGATFNLKDDDVDADGNLVESCFRAYDSPEDSWRDHSEFLQQPRYQSLFDNGSDYRAWAYGLQTAGYATDPEYGNKIVGIIERYELYKLDGLVGAIPAPITMAIESAENAPKAEVIPASKAKVSTPKNDNELFEITPQSEIRFDENIEKEDAVKPKATKIPTDYIRGQGKKLLEGLFNNLKKVELPTNKYNKKKVNLDELDEITPEKENFQHKGEDNRTSSSRMISEKVVAMR